MSRETRGGDETRNVRIPIETFVDADGDREDYPLTGKIDLQWALQINAALDRLAAIEDAPRQPEPGWRDAFLDLFGSIARRHDSRTFNYPLVVPDAAYSKARSALSALQHAREVSCPPTGDAIGTIVPHSPAGYPYWRGERYMGTETAEDARMSGTGFEGPAGKPQAAGVSGDRPDPLPASSARVASSAVSARETVVAVTDARATQLTGEYVHPASVPVESTRETAAQQIAAALTDDVCYKIGLAWHLSYIARAQTILQCCEQVRQNVAPLLAAALARAEQAESERDDWRLSFETSNKHVGTLQAELAALRTSDTRRERASPYQDGDNATIPPCHPTKAT